MRRTCGILCVASKMVVSRSFRMRLIISSIFITLAGSRLKPCALPCLRKAYRLSISPDPRVRRYPELHSPCFNRLFINTANFQSVSDILKNGFIKNSRCLEKQGHPAQDIDNSWCFHTIDFQVQHGGQLDSKQSHRGKYFYGLVTLPASSSGTKSASPNLSLP